MYFYAMFAKNKLKPLPGRLLVAEPYLHDSHFKRAVVLLVEHNEKGSVGFILNKPLEFNVADAINNFPAFDSKACYGGPVHGDQLYFVHTLGTKIKDSIPIGNGLFWLGNFEEVKLLILANLIDSSQIIFFVGYAGWEVGQLEKEILEKSWFVSNSDHALIFKTDSSAMWTETVKKMGKSFAQMVNFPKDPSMN